MSHILGIDVSTAIVGISILDRISGNLALLDHIELSKLPDIYEKSDLVNKYLIELNKKYSIEYVYIEEALQRFRQGASSARTISILNKFNGIVTYLSYKAFNVKPEHILAPHARKVCGVIITKKEKKLKGAKQITFEYVKNELNDKFILQYKRTGKMKDWMKLFSLQLEKGR